MTQSISILGIPWDEQSSYLKGCAEGPRAIRDAFECESTNTFCEAGFDVRGHRRIRDLGDLEIESEEAACAAIESAVMQQLQSGNQVLSLGGDHAITWPILRAYAANYPSIDVLHIDAHPDLYDELDGNRFSHATPFARALEQGLIGQLVQVGIRTMNDHQQKQVDRYDIRIIPMNRFRPGIELHFDGPVYLSMDLDVLDPACAPGVSHHEPGGMTTRELINLIQGLDVDLVGADIVELNPSRDLQGVTAMTAAKLMKEILSAMLQ